MAQDFSQTKSKEKKEKSVYSGVRVQMFQLKHQEGPGSSPGFSQFDVECLEKASTYISSTQSMAK